jgi:hypothetical protein
MIEPHCDFFLRYHRLALSVKGDSATLLAECGTISVTRKLQRPLPSRINGAGIMLVGQELLNEEHFTVRKFYSKEKNQLIHFCATFFQGDMQLLMIAPRPDIAYDLCDYVPLCKDEEAIETANVTPQPSDFSCFIFDRNDSRDNFFRQKKEEES